MAASLCHSLVPHTIMQLFIFSLSLTLFILYAALIIYYTISWKSIPVYNPENNKTDKYQAASFYFTPANGERETGNAKQTTKISIIIPARNEEQNIKACLGSIFDQTYPTELYEVIVVDDHSTDGTANIVKKYAAKKVRLISLEDHINAKALNSYKKKAIEIAVAQSTGDLIVTADADCIAGKNWLRTIASFYEEKNPAFIAMPVTFSSNKNAVEIFQSLDFMTLQGITGASVHKHMHSMCNGANLAYTKKAFYEAGGFKGIDHLASGDDMLLMHKIYLQQPAKVFFLKSKDVIVQTQPMKTVSDFFSQRIRWASKADSYDDKRIIAVLLLVYLFNVLLVILPLLSLIPHSPFSILNYQLSLIQFWLMLLGCKTVIELAFLYPVANFFSKQRLLFYFPIAQPFHIVYTVIAGWLGKFGTYQWKGRAVK